MNATSRLCLSGLSAAGIAVSLACPAHAGLMIAGTVATINDVVSSSATGTLTLNETFPNGIQFDGVTLTSTGTPANPGSDALTLSGSFINTTNNFRSLSLLFGDTDFSAPVSQFTTSISGTYQFPAPITGTSGLGGFTVSSFDDPQNGQGGLPFPANIPGNLLSTLFVSSVMDTESFGPGMCPLGGTCTATGSVTDNAPFSMTVNITGLALPPNTTLNLSTILTKSIPAAVPEPSTWAMLLLGFAGLGFVRYRQTRRAKPQAA